MYFTQHEKAAETWVYTVLCSSRVIFMDGETKILLITCKTGVMISAIPPLTHYTKWTRPYVFTTLEHSLELGIVKLTVFQIQGCSLSDFKNHKNN